MNRSLVLVPMAVLAVPLSTSAQVVNISQTREVTATASSVEAIVASTDQVGSWSRTVERRTGGGFQSGGIGSQFSLVSPTQFSGRGLAIANDDVQTTSGSASSSFNAVFDVTQPTAFSLVGSWRTDYDFFPHQFPSTLFRFERLSPNPEIYHNSFFFHDFQSGAFALTGSANLAGVLPEGRYSISMTVGISVFGNPGVYDGDAEFNFDLRVPSASVVSFAAIVGAGSIRRRRR